MGRHEKPIDWEKVDFYLMSGSKQYDIAASVGVDKKTFIKHFKKKYNKDFSTYSTEKYACGNQLLEAAQFQKAIKSSSPGNTQMLIWLGKVRLGQKETVNTVNTNAPNETSLEKDQENMALKHRIAELEKTVADLSKTG